MTQQSVPEQGATYGYSAAVDPNDSSSPADGYLGVGSGKQSDGLGEVFHTTNPAGGTWSTMGLNLATQTHCAPNNDGGRPLGLAVGRGASNEIVVIAAV